MDPLTATAALVGTLLAGTSSVAWRLHWRVRRAEAQAADLRRALRDEYNAANHDPLTGLPNRRGFFRQGEALMADPARHPLVAVVIDLDDFKPLNDRFGHTVGDQALATIATRFAAWAELELAGPTDPAAPRRPGQVVARLGGDEFAGLLSATSTDYRWLRATAQRLTQMLAAPMHVAGHQLRVTASVGITVAPAATSLTDALRRADAAMYQAKAGGRADRPADLRLG